MIPCLVEKLDKIRKQY
uniref:Uncharacterized protein n=1 Tax=Rhizophora mucronata TaxID=61149 RepID=A0A2P2JBF1_RHIMU